MLFRSFQHQRKRERTGQKQMPQENPFEKEETIIRIKHPKG